MNTIQPLVHRIPGSKQAHLKLWEPILNAHNYVISYEPFAGGLAVSNYLLQKDKPTLKTVVCAEIDPSLRGLYQAWGHEDLEYALCSQLQDWQTYPIKDVLNHLKVAYEKLWAEFEPNYINAAVAGLLLRYVSFNGKLAPNAKSQRLNIKFSDQQLKKWGKFKYTFPPAPEHLYVYDDQGYIDWDAFKDQPSITIIDPPYVGTVGHVKYRDPDFIRPVYFKHQPHSRETLRMAFSPVEEALSHDVTVIITCNYYSDSLNDDYESIGQDYGYECFQFDGIQQKLNNGTKPTKKKPYYTDTYWVFCRPDDPFVDILSCSCEH
ncbi:hypothetical protein Lepto7375DRAFT_7228 [Leptolyngbya sp. PCC 7375]|nr:hypothetical protein Lepto7375DRAFT_7228 [Leptolyngbya sp. PCC 7375]